MTTSPDTTMFTRWRKSSHSGGQSDCVEVGFSRAPAGEQKVGVRDSTNPGGPTLVFTKTEWTIFIAATKCPDLG